MEIRSLKSKKGIFFTIAALFFAVLLITLSSIVIQYKLSDQMSVVRSRVGQMEIFMQSLEEDLDRAAFISTFRGMLALNNYMTSNGTYLSDAQAQLEQIIVNGTILGNQQIESLMLNQTLVNWSTKAEGIGDALGITTSVTFISASISQSDPWNIEITSRYNITVSDNRNTARLSKELTKVSKLPIDGLEDPTYRIETNGVLSRSIVPTNTTDWNVTALRWHVDNGTYRSSTNAPSFLMRLEGSFGSSVNGIQSLVDKVEFQAFSISVTNHSNVDYLYWSQTGGNLSGITGITDQGRPDFRLDGTNVQLYNVSGDVQ